MGVEALTPGPGQIVLSHLPYLREPDVINWPVGQNSKGVTLSHA